MPLFTFGSNGSGQLGLGHTEDIAIPERCSFDEATRTAAAAEGEAEVGREEELDMNMDIVRIVAGGNHTLVLLRDGRVYAAGCNVDGRCGQHHQEESSLLRFKPVIITTEDGEIYKAFKNVSATWEGTFLVASSLHNSNNNEEQKDAVLALGSGPKGELGLGTTKPQTTTPKKIPNFPPPNTKITSLASGMGHTAAVLSTGEVYGWGGARKGQLGEAAKLRKVVWGPVRVEGVPFSATGVVCGREFTVVAGDEEKGEHVVLGSCDDKWGIVSGGPGSISGGDDSGLPPYANICAGWHAIYIQHEEKNNSSITAWGRNDRGQLPSADLPNPRMLAVGSEHALALLDDRTVVAFGWGEHGNCGIETDAQGNVKGRYNKIEVPGIEQGEIVGVGAGCATSWIVTS